MESQGPTFGAHFWIFVKKWGCLVKTNIFGTRKLRALPRTVYLVKVLETKLTNSVLRVE